MSGAGDIVNLAIERARRGLAPAPDPLALLEVGGRVEFERGFTGFIDTIGRDTSGRVTAVWINVLGRRVRLMPDQILPPAPAASAL